MSRKTTSVTGLSGNLGVGRPTVLNDFLPPRTDVTSAIHANDMDEGTVDADRLADHSDMAENSEDRCRT
jgi:G3E family GTPase